MANITGTSSNDILTGTAADDTIQGLGGDDRIIASDGIDLIDGGAGNDTVDYSNYNDRVAGFSLDKNGNLEAFKGNFGSGSEGRDTLVNIERIIGKKDGLFAIGGLEKIDVDLSRNRATYSSPFGTKTIGIENFVNILGTRGNDRLKGDDRDNVINPIEGVDVIVGSKGSDTIGNLVPFTAIFNVKNTVDYSDIGRAVTLKTSLAGGLRGSTSIGLTVDKGDFGIDKVLAGTIIGASNKANTIDASNTTSPNPFDPKETAIDVNLANNSLKFITNFNPLQDSFSVSNFANVIGTNRNDTIVGADKRGKLTGGGGNDTITGGNKNDVLTGSDSTARGVGEVDVLTGGGGRDKFVLGDANGAYYVGKGKDDFATITDFNIFQDSISLGGFKNYSFGFGANNSIELYSGKDVNTRDLIAKIQLSGGGINLSRAKTSGLQVESAISSQINILSGASAIADTAI
jgi:Ca2+-binding RTX toxin-like protein